MRVRVWCLVGACVGLMLWGSVGCWMGGSSPHEGAPMSAQILIYSSGVDGYTYKLHHSYDRRRGGGPQCWQGTWEEAGAYRLHRSAVTDAQVEAALALVPDPLQARTSEDAPVFVQAYRSALEAREAAWSGPRDATQEGLRSGWLSVVEAEALRDELARVCGEVQDG